MAQYTIRPGVAAVAAIHCEGQHVRTAIFLGPDRLDPHAGDKARVSWEFASAPAASPRDGIPVPVLAAVHRHFGTVFALPVERREAYLRSLPSGGITVEA